MEFYWLHFDGPYARAYFQFLQNLINFPISLDTDQAIKMERLFSVLIDGSSGDYYLNEIQFGKYITDILTLPAIMPRESPTEASGKSIPENIATACDQAAAFMRRHFMEALTIQAVAENVSLSPYYFIRRFKEIFKLTPHQYLLNIRLDSARFYLNTTDKTIKEIAFSCGFRSENNFCIAFKKQIGLTPTCYRNLD